MAYCTVGTAGHIDHGKTSLVKALTGVDTDRLSEEKARGLSIELGFAHFEAGALHISIVDVPGHEKFIRTMLAGTTGIDLALFVIAADDGVMPQSREHLDIVRLLNIKSAVFVISKSDRVEERRINEVMDEVRELIKGTHLEGSPFVSTSTETGEGITTLRALIVDACSEIKRRERGLFFRLPIDRSFSVKGFGTVVTGTIASGEVCKNDTVSAFTPRPKLPAVRVRGIESTHQKVECAGSGARAALNIANLPRGTLGRGVTLADSSLVDYAYSALKTTPGGAKTLKIDCSFEFLPSFLTKGFLKGKRMKSLKLFHLTGESLVSVRFPIRSDSGSSESGFGRLTLSTPLLALRGDYFILRDTATNSTVGGGTVLVPYYDPRLARALPSIEYSDLQGDDISKLLLAILGPREVGLKLTGLEYMLNLPLDDIIRDARGFYRSGEFLISVERSEGLRDRVAQVLKKFHSQNPSKEGASITTILSLLACETYSWRLAGASLVKAIFEEMLADGLLRRLGTLLSLARHTPRLAETDRAVEKAVLTFFTPALNAIKADELYRLPFKRTEVDRVLAYLLNKRRIVKLKEGRFLLNSSIDGALISLKGALTALANISTGSQEETPQGITVSEFRDILGTGRKMAMEILEYFDRELVTIRHGDYRVLRNSSPGGGEQ